jgi:predicted alpha/beta-hydrolase family hydrolase
LVKPHVLRLRPETARRRHDPGLRAPTASPKTEADRFGNCPICGALPDMRDLTHVPAPVHDAETEIGEGPEPPARDGPD